MTKQREDSNPSSKHGEHIERHYLGESGELTSRSAESDCGSVELEVY